MFPFLPEKKKKDDLNLEYLYIDVVEIMPEQGAKDREEKKEERGVLIIELM